jgi:hypothetical protein
VTNAPDVYVYEIGMGIVAHAAPVERKSSFAQLLGIHAGHSKIDRLRLHVKAVFGNSLRMSAKELIAPRCSVSTYNIDLSARPVDSHSQLLKEIIKSRLKMPDITRTMVAEKIVELADGLRNIGVPPAVYDVEPFSGVGVIELEPIFLVRCC